jgi:microcystin-dependent protein
MKKIITILSALFITTNVFAQSPQRMSYQAVVRNTSNNLVLSAPVGMRVSIIQGSIFGASVYVETQNPITNSNGLISISIGTGTIVTGSFSTVNWANGPYFIKTETDPLGGTAYSIIGTSELMSVPYALYAGNATTYTSGNGISISSGTIANTAPNQTVNISAAGISSVTGTYPNYTINTPNHIAGAGISVSGATITNSAPDKTVTLTGTGATSITGVYPNYTVNSPIVSGIPVGTILPFAGSTVPAGYLICDGAQINRITYANLFSVIGSSWGNGNGTTTFHVPDFRGRFMRGQNAGSGQDPDAATRTAINTGGNTGDNVGTVQSGGLSSHNHNLTILGGCSGNNAASSVSYLSGSNNGGTLWSTSPCGNPTNNTVSIASSGGSETRPSNVSVKYIIKY